MAFRFGQKISFAVFVCFLVVLLCGCSFQRDENDDELISETDQLYKELTGTYKLIKSEVTYTGQAKQILEPPDVTGTMKITSKRKISQRLIVFGLVVQVSGTYEINSDEGTMIVKNDPGDIISQMAYTWDGKIFTTDLKSQAYTEKDFWQKD